MNLPYLWLRKRRRFSVLGLQKFMCVVAAVPASSPAAADPPRGVSVTSVSDKPLAYSRQNPSQQTDRKSLRG